MVCFLKNHAREKKKNLFPCLGIGPLLILSREPTPFPLILQQGGCENHNFAKYLILCFAKCSKNSAKCRENLSYFVKISCFVKFFKCCFAAALSFTYFPAVVYIVVEAAVAANVVVFMFLYTDCGGIKVKHKQQKRNCTFN